MSSDRKKSALGELWEREMASARAKLDADDELLAQAVAGGPFWGEGNIRQAQRCEVCGRDVSEVWIESRRERRTLPPGNGKGWTVLSMQRSRRPLRSMELASGVEIHTCGLADCLTMARRGKWR